MGILETQTSQVRLDITAFPSDYGQLILDTYASDKTMGAVLSQLQAGSVSQLMAVMLRRLSTTTVLNMQHTTPNSKR